MALSIGAGACSGTSPGPRITVLMGTAPDSLDPGIGSSGQAGEADWLSYLPLLTYRHASGPAGKRLIPGLAASLPRVTDGGRTYTFHLRSKLTYSNGDPVKASDFPYTVERTIRLNWAGKGRLTSQIVGAAAYDRHLTRAIAGIEVNDVTRRVTIRLNSPSGSFENVLALPAVGLLPSGTPMTDLSSNPPPGAGPYSISRVVARRGFTLTRNSSFAKMHVPGVPAGFAKRIDVRFISDPAAEAQQVLTNRADALDPRDFIPADWLRAIKRSAADRFATQASEPTSLRSSGHRGPLYKFLSRRIDFPAAVLHPVFLNDWSSWRVR